MTSIKVCQKSYKLPLNSSLTNNIEVLLKLKLTGYFSFDCIEKNIYVNFSMTVKKKLFIVASACVFVK